MAEHTCIHEADIATCMANITNLEDWQGKQNGMLQRLDGRIDKLGNKIDKLLYWVIALMGTALLSLLLLLLNVKR
jgi:hypothetical protein